MVTTAIQYTLIIPLMFHAWPMYVHGIYRYSVTHYYNVYIHIKYDYLRNGYMVVQDTMQRFPYKPFRKHNHKSVRKHTEIVGELLQWLNKVTLEHNQPSVDGKNLNKMVTHSYS